MAHVCCVKDSLHILSGEEDSAVYGHLRNGTLDGIIHSQGYACLDTEYGSQALPKEVV